MKPTKKLMRDFAKVVLPEYSPSENIDGWYFFDLPNKTIRLNIQDWSVLIKIVRNWSKDGLVMQSLIDRKWRVYVGFHPHDPKNDDKHLPTAIMKAVVAAAKSEGA